MDCIVIEDIVCYSHHGVLPEEIRLGQEFRVSLELGISLSVPFEDRIEETADYRQAVLIVEEVIYGESCRLLETLACRIAEKLLTMPRVKEATVEVRKPNPPLPGVHGGVSVIVKRGK